MLCNRILCIFFSLITTLLKKFTEIWIRLVFCLTSFLDAEDTTGNVLDECLDDRNALNDDGILERANGEIEIDIEDDDDYYGVRWKNKTSIKRMCYV